jgi:peptide/nickel transport system permease protein
MTLARLGHWLGLFVLASLLVVALLADPLAGGAAWASPQHALPGAGAREIARWWVMATRNTVAVVVTTTALAAVLGTALGAASVYGGAGAGGLLARLVEFTGAVPGLILVGLLRFWDASGGILALVGTLALLRALEVAQLVRAQVLTTIPSDFVEASRALGASRGWQLRVHVLPPLARPLLVNLLLGASSLIGLEAALSFTGLGLPSDTPSWGGGLAAVAGGGNGVALAWVVGSIGLTSVALYGLSVIHASARPPVAMAGHVKSATIPAA